MSRLYLRMVFTRSLHRWFFILFYSYRCLKHRLYSVCIHLLSSNRGRHLWFSKYFKFLSVCLCVSFLWRFLHFSVWVFPFFSHLHNKWFRNQVLKLQYKVTTVLPHKVHRTTVAQLMWVSHKRTTLSCSGTWIWMA